MTLAELRVFAEGLDRRGHNVPIRSVALTLLARNAQDDGMIPKAETEAEVQEAIFGLLYCSMFLCAALELDLNDLVAHAHDCFLTTEDAVARLVVG